MILTVCANPSVDSFWSIDQIKKRSANRSVQESFYPGGKGLHVAFALNKLGIKVTNLSVWGGQTGKWLQEQCFNNNIDTIGPSVRQWTRICITVNSSSEWNETELLGSGPTITPDKAGAFINAFQYFIKTEKPSAVVISGSIPQGFNQNLYSQLISFAHQENALTFLDASGTLLQKSLEAKPYSVHINQHEGEELCNTDDPVKLVQWLENYCTLPAVTAGADGLYLLFEEQLYHATCEIPSEQIISTVGSGDCLLAGLCFAVLKYKDPARWVRHATACGSANCIHKELGMLDVKDVEKLLDKVSLEKI